MPRLLDSLFSDGVVTAEGAPRLVDDELYPEERAYIQRAVPKRRAEFGTARVLARRALSALSVAAAPLVPDVDRAPLWPKGVAGSIAHADDYCAVVIGRSPPFSSLGLDVERLQTFDDAMTLLVLTDEEQRRWRAAPDARRRHFAVVAFSCKEAFYKCQYPVTRAFLDFREVELELDWDLGQFQTRVLKPGWPAGLSSLQGRFVLLEHHVVSGVELVSRRLDSPGNNGRVA